MPLSFLHRLGGVVGGLFHALPNRARATTYKNIRTCFPDLDEAGVERLARESLRNTACTALEMGKAWIHSPERIIDLTVETRGYEEFCAALDEGNGAILLAPHLGNWEVFGYFAIKGINATFMYQPPHSLAMDRILKEGRSKSGVCLAPATRKGVAQVLKALERGELVGILPDQVPAEGSGAFAEFFGESAYTMTLISKLVRRTNASVFCGFGQRLPEAEGFLAVFEKADSAIYSEDVDESLRGLNASVENVVRQAPSQYQWEYKRFRRRLDNSEFY